MSDNDWQIAKIENPHFRCRKCSGKNISYRDRDEDTKYRCNDCSHMWWVEGSDA